MSASDSAGREVAESEREGAVVLPRQGARRGGPDVREADRRAAAHPGLPYGTSLLGLIRHLTGAEEHWFQRVFLGQDHDIDLSMTVPPAPPATRSPPAGRRVPAATRSAGPDLSTVAAIANPGKAHPVSLRPIVTHMIEETARHAGHADILREQIDGAAGR